MANNTDLVNNMSSVISADTAFVEAYTQLANKVALETGDPSFARFMQAMTQISREVIKPEIGSVKSALKPEKVKKPKTDRAPVDNTWRTEQKDLFTGRGRQWIYVPIETVEAFREESNVHEFFDTHGLAWIRYSGPRIVDNTQQAAFEVRTLGSKINAPQNLVYLPHDEIMLNEFDRLEDGKTPHQLKLEETQSESESHQDEESAVINLDGGGELIPNEETTEDSIPVEMLADDEEELDDSIF
jgi:DNA-binding protein H-NS